MLGDAASRKNVTSAAEPLMIEDVHQRERDRCLFNRQKVGDAPTGRAQEEVSLGMRTAELGGIDVTVARQGELRGCLRGSRCFGADVTMIQVRRTYMRRFTLLPALATSLSCGEGEPSGPPPPAPPPVPTSVAVSPGELTLTALDMTGSLSARVRDQHRRPLAGVPLLWRSNAPSIVTVDSSGRVTAVDNGRATITASAGEASGEAVVTVAQQAATLELAPPDTVRTYGDTARVAARSSDVNGHAIPPTLLTWTSGDTRIVTVDSTGLVTATGNGTASVSAWSGPFRVSVDVTVYDLAEARKTDREVLMILFNGGRNHVWRSKENWGTEAPLSTWAGVSTDEEGRVTALSLPENQIGGEIPSELGNLDRLEILDLSRNSFSGVIPPELGSLERLTTLNLSRNRIRMPIPPEFGNLANLRVLNLNYLNRDGVEEPLPAEVFGLTHLEVLRLAGTGLRGPIPPELAKLSNLRVLDLGRNGDKMVGPIPPELGDMANLEVLRLDGSRLSGGIPPELGRLTKLDTLNLVNSWIGGRIPSELGNLTNLRSLSLGNFPGYPYPDINTPRPGYVWELLVTLAERNARLEELFVQNGTGGPIPPEIARLTQLKKLTWVGGGLPGPIPPEIGKLTNLSELVLFENNLTGPLPPELGDLGQLIRLTPDPAIVGAGLVREGGRSRAVEALTIVRS